MTEITPIDQMLFWNELDSTDPSFTKKSTEGAKLTSINGVYQFKKMTELFGPCGIGWGWETITSQLDVTATMYQRQWNEETRSQELVMVGGQPISYGPGQLHTLKIKLWYRPLHQPEGGVAPPQWEWSMLVSPPGADSAPARYEIEGIGQTKFIYLTKNGPFVDEDYEKKSLTDALTNAMSKLGMAADVRMGMFDDTDYLMAQQRLADIATSDDAEVEIVKQRQEFEEWYATHLGLIKTETDNRVLEVLFTGATPRMTREATQDQIDERYNAKNDTFRRNMPKKEEQPSE